MKCDVCGKTEHDRVKIFELSKAKETFSDHVKILGLEGKLYKKHIFVCSDHYQSCDIGLKYLKKNAKPITPNAITIETETIENNSNNAQEIEEEGDLTAEELNNLALVSEHRSVWFDDDDTRYLADVQCERCSRNELFY